jgi:hypothetical protein
MRLLRLLSDGTLEITEFFQPPPYAILSHRWEAGEVTLQELANPESSTKPGYAKIIACCLQAAIDGYEYSWVDTCCIDKTSSSELSESINSMFKWYQQAGICYAYLSDISIAPETEFSRCESPVWSPESPLSRPLSQIGDYWPESTSLPYCCPESIFDSLSTSPPIGDGFDEGFERFSTTPNSASDIFRSQYFSRGWTLQELIAPKKVVFYSGEWQKISTKEELIDDLSYATGIDAAALRGEPLASFSVANRMCWASQRKTTREEDTAYCLLGLFDVNMPLLYGEGRVKAFIRLQEEIMKACDDRTLFASHPDGDNEPQYLGLFAESPAWFRSSRTTDHYWATNRLPPARLTNLGVSIQLPISELENTTIGWLNCQIETNKHRGLAGVFLAKVGELENTYLRQRSRHTKRCPWLAIQDLNPDTGIEGRIEVREILVLHKAPLWYNEERLPARETSKFSIHLTFGSASETYSGPYRLSSVYPPSQWQPEVCRMVYNNAPDKTMWNTGYLFENQEQERFCLAVRWKFEEHKYGSARSLATALIAVSITRMPTGFSLQHWMSIEPHLQHAGAATIEMDAQHRVIGVVTRTLRTGLVAVASLEVKASKLFVGVHRNADDYEKWCTDSLLMSVSVVDKKEAEVSEIIAYIIEPKRDINYQ